MRDLTMVSGGRNVSFNRHDFYVAVVFRITYTAWNKQLKERCAWAGNDSLYIEYHDKEWGVPSHVDRHLFEMLILEGAQAGFSWITILRKRENYQRAFANWDANKIARFDEKDIARLMNDAGMVRNRLKISATIDNAI